MKSSWTLFRSSEKNRFYWIRAQKIHFNLLVEYELPQNISRLEAKRKTKDDLHQNKTDKLDALYLAKLQSEHPQRLAYVQSEEYQELMANNRIYEQASYDLITNKNRLHKAIQLTFPEIEHLMANPRGKNYWSIVLRFPHPDIVLETKEADIIDFLKGLTGIGKKRANDIAQSLIRLAKVACPAVKKNSAHIRGLEIAH